MEFCNRLSKLAGLDTCYTGVGKTIVLRTYLEKSKDAGLKVIYLFHANISFGDLVKTIYQELGLEPALELPVVEEEDLVSGHRHDERAPR